jgi:hypothetical protein
LVEVGLDGTDKCIVEGGDFETSLVLRKADFRWFAISIDVLALFGSGRGYLRDGVKELIEMSPFRKC